MRACALTDTRRKFLATVAETRKLFTANQGELLSFVEFLRNEVIMESHQEKRPVQSAVFTLQDGKNAALRLQRQITDLEERLENYFQRLDELEKFCERTQDKFEDTQRRIREEYELIKKQNATRKTDHSATRKRTKERIERRNEKDAQSMHENDLDVSEDGIKQTVTTSSEVKEMNSFEVR